VIFRKNKAIYCSIVQYFFYFFYSIEITLCLLFNTTLLDFERSLSQKSLFERIEELEKRLSVARFNFSVIYGINEKKERLKGSQCSICSMGQRAFGGRTKLWGGKEIIERIAKERGFATDSEFARYLHSIEPTRSFQGWRNAILRWKKEGFGYIKPELKLSSSSRVSIYYDEKEDIYITFLPSVNQMVKMDGETHRKMKKAYSDGGEGLNMRELSRKFSLPELYIHDYIKAHKWSHGMDIFTDEDMKSRSEESLVLELVESKRNKVLEKANKKFWREVSNDADRMRNLDFTLLNEFRQALSNKNLAPKTPKNRKMKSAAPYAVVISPTDLHFGEECWIDETGTHYNTEEARKRLIDRTENLISRLPGRPEKIYVATGSDWFHVDNEQGTTTKGTPQDLSTSPSQIFMDGCSLAREHIDLLRTVCPIEVIFMRGNHDRHTSLALMMYLGAVYENTTDVKVITNPMLRQYSIWGNNLIGFTHGDGIRGLDLPLLMASEERGAWGSCEHHVWFHGHLHHQRLIEKGGTTVIQLPSLAGNDRWHFQKGHVLARAGICAHLLDKDLGLIGNLFAPVILDE